jgi:inner membrane protein
MDGLTHSLVGLASAKAGLERLSPYTAACCMLSANAPDIDVVAYFFGGRWTLLQHHRGITHSIIGVLVLAALIPTIFFGIEWAIAGWRKTTRRINYPGLLLASLIATATHPLMDWTNSYGVRPFLPWDGRWLYGDLVFIVDPYLLLILCGSCFLLTSNRRAKMVFWSLLAALVTVMVFLASPQRQASSTALTVARIVWITGILIFATIRLLKIQRRFGRFPAIAALAFVVLYWGGLAWAHSAAYRNAFTEANALAYHQGERFVQVAAMPTVANPFRWLCVAETDRALYRYIVGTGEGERPDYRINSAGVENGPGSTFPIERFEKPSGRGEQLVASASKDPRAQVLLGFARFAFARPESESCIGRTLVQFADLRYTEPGVSRGSFSLDVPLECPTP